MPLEKISYKKKSGAPPRFNTLQISCVYRKIFDEVIPIDILTNRGRHLYDLNYAVSESYTYRWQYTRLETRDLF